MSKLSQKDGISSLHTRTYREKTCFNIGHRQRLSIILNMVSKNEFSEETSMIDCGCSDGYILSKIQSSAQAGTFLGIDRSNELLKIAKQKENARLKFRNADLNRSLPFPDESFNILTSFETLEHVADYSFTLNEYFRILKKDGIMIISIPNEIGFVSIIKNAGRVFRDIGNGVGLRESYNNHRLSLRYLLTSLFGGNIESFRPKSEQGHGPHMGFDYRNLLSVIRRHNPSQRMVKFVPSLMPLSVVVRIRK